MNKPAKMLKRVTLKDIAQASGFSINTVSHALNDKPDISKETKDIIKKAAKDMGYIRNSSAEFLRSGVSRTVAVVLGDISNPLFAIMVKEIESKLKEHDYVSFILNTDEDEKIEYAALKTALEKNVDGIILCPSPNGKENIAFLQSRGVPFVLHGRYFNDLETNAVLYDDQKCGYLAAKHLLELGHRDILFVNAPVAVSSARERMNGYKEALLEYGVTNPKVATVTLSPHHRLEQLKQALLSDRSYTAVIAFSDMIALEVISILKEQNYSVPEDISVVGFDNIQSNYLLPTQITTVSSSKKLMVKKSVELLMEQIQTRKQESIKMLFPAELKVRETTRSIR